MPDGPAHEEPAPEQPKDTVSADGIESFANPAEGRVISPSGETLTCVLFAEAAYEAELVALSGGEDWVGISKGASGEKGRNNIRIVFAKN